MLAKTARLNKPEDYDTVYKSSRPVHGTHLTIRTAAGDGPAKVGFVVSTQVSKKATVRNLLKRRLRAIVREL
jgi:ribonuclease P protein component